MNKYYIIIFYIQYAHFVHNATELCDLVPNATFLTQNFTFHRFT